MKNLPLFQQLYWPKVSGLFNPTSLGTMIGWWRANEGVTSSGGSVSQWNDLSGSGNHLKQTTATNKPTLITSGLNGLDTISFDGSNDYMQLDSTLTGINNLTYFIVYKRRVNTSQAVMSSGASDYQYLQYGNSWYIGNSSHTNFPMTNGQFYIRCGTATTSGNVKKYYSNGTFNNHSITGGDGNFTTFRYIASAGGAYLDGEIAEIWFFSEVLGLSSISLGFTGMNSIYSVY